MCRLFQFLPLPGLFSGQIFNVLLILVTLLAMRISADGEAVAKPGPKQCTYHNNCSVLLFFGPVTLIIRPFFI